MNMSHKKRWENKPNKSGSRQHFFSHVSKPSEVALEFPGSGCMSIKEGIRSGKYDENTFFIAVEEVSETAEKIKEYLAYCKKNKT